MPKYQITLEVNVTLADIEDYINGIVEEYPCVADEDIKILGLMEIKDA